MNDENNYEQLLIENKYLKELLKTNNIDFNEHKIFSFEELKVKEKISIYSSLFIGRNDVFATRYLDKEGNKHYTPLCENNFNYNLCNHKKYLKCQGCPNKKYHGLTDKDIINHLTGKKYYAIYPLLDGDLTNFIAIDFDGDDFKKCANSFRKVANSYNIDTAIEISQSGNGCHAWIFFKTPIKARNARTLCDYLMDKTIDSEKNLSFSSFDRYFPSQDYLPKNGFGNLIALPLEKNLVAEGKTVFVDENFMPYKSQFGYLKLLNKVDVSVVNKIVFNYIKDNVNDIVNLKYLKNLKITNKDFDDLKITLNENIMIPKKCLSLKAYKLLIRISTIPNKDYYQKEYKRVNTYGIPRVLNLYKEDSDFLYLPRGVYKLLIDILKQYKIEYKCENIRTKGEKLDITFKGTLYPEQVEALKSFDKSNSGLFLAPTAFGKTIVAIALIAKLKISTLILVEKNSLINQWVNKLNDFLDINYEYNPKNKFGVYYGSKKKLTYKIDAGSINSFSEDSKSNEIFKKYGLVIIDEAHHVGAYTYEKVVKNIPCFYLYGLTATLKRSDGNEKIVTKNIGEVIYEAKTIDSIIKRCFVRFTDFNLLANERLLLNYAESINELVSDQTRNNLIINDTTKLINEKRNILILSDRVEHTEVLYDALVNLKIKNVFLLNGSLKTADKKTAYDNIASIKENGFIIIATSKLIGEGFDNLLLDTLLITTPFKWEGTLKQYVGRLERKAKNKKDIIVYDYVDFKIPMFFNMFNVRKTAYKSKGFIIDEGDNAIFKNIYFVEDFKKKLMDDVINAQKEIIIINNNIDEKLIKEIIIKNENIKYLLYSRNNLKDSFKNVLIKEPLNISNIILIDSSIIWYGTLNPLSSINSLDSSIIRLCDSYYCDEIIKQIIK